MNAMIRMNYSLKELICCCTYFLFALTAVATNKFPAIELQALKAFYSSTNGNHWNWKNNTLLYGIPWNFAESNPNPCGERWQGIYCTATCTTLSPCNVQEIVLYSRNLVGKIPPSISNFSHLNYLELSENKISGTLPSQIGSLLLLTQIKISNNNLQGTLPKSLSKLSLLTTLDVSYNEFYGEIPPSFSSLRSLKVFNLESNRFTGTIPSFFYTSYPNLTSIFLCYNNFHGTISPMIKSMKKVTKVYLNNNNLVGSIPSELGELPGLTLIDLDSNALTGTIPSSLTQLHQLQSLYLYNNKLNGTLPQNVSGWKALTSLYLNLNALSGTIPSTLGSSLPTLQILQLCYNRLTGTIPTTLGQLKQLEALVLCENQLNGTLPSVLTTSLPQLRMLILSTNQLVGTVPSTIDQLTRLLYLYLDDNDFTGQIPCSIGNLSTLLYFNLYNNAFTGTLCASWGQLSNLIILSVSYNQIRGIIPPALCGPYPKLQDYFLNNNLLTGPIPSCIGQVSSALINLAVNINQLTGTLPTNLTQFPVLEQFLVHTNLLHGPIPESVYSMTSLVFFDAYQNFFSGPISESVSNLVQLQEYLVYTNALTSTIPESFWSLPSMDTVAIYDNQLSGDLFSPALCARSGTYLSTVHVLDAFFNQFSGTIPSDCTLKGMQYVFVQDNFFYGPLIGLAGNKALLGLNVSDNFFSGNLHFPSYSPATTSVFSNMSSMLTLDLSDNMLSGSVANVLEHMDSLTIFVLKSNHFTGNIHELVHSNSHNLSVLDLSDNQFTGSLPGSLFLNRTQLLSFAAVKNCFSGSIPPAICTCPQLQTLALDGLHTAYGCQRRFFSSWIPSIDTYELVDRVVGGIPDCLWNMSTLQTLHLSGNGITGSISPTVQYSTFLQDVALSYNLLTGTIPEAMQTKTWNSLDLSFNKLSGLLDDFASLSANGSISLVVNRFSGMIPASLQGKTTKSMNVLTGNLFDCSRDAIRDHSTTATSLPSQDANSQTYTCGTDTINKALIVWIGCAFVSLVTLISILSLGNTTSSSPSFLSGARWQAWVAWCRDFSQLVVECWSVSNNLALDGLEQQQTAGLYVLGKNMKALRRLVLLFTAFALFVLLPVYCLLSLTYGTHTYSYAWTVSVAYVSGFTPAIVVFVIMVLFYIVIGEKVLYYIKKLRMIYANTQASLHLLEQRDESQDMPHRLAIVLVGESTTAIQNELERRKMWWSVRGRYVLLGGLLIAINTVIVMTANTAYVYASSLGLPTVYQAILSLSLSIFKICWTYFIVLGLFDHFLSYCEDGIEAQTRHYHKRHSMKHQESLNNFHRHDLASLDRIQRVVILSSLVIFNSICAPFLANAFVDSNCFYYVVHTPASVAVSYNLVECSQFSVGSLPITCIGTFTNSRSVNYIPPFNYSYQCSSSLLHDFVTVFIFRYFISAFVMPGFSVSWKLLREEEHFEQWKNAWITYLFGGTLNDRERMVKKEEASSARPLDHREGDIELQQVAMGDDELNNSQPIARKSLIEDRGKEDEGDREVVANPLVGRLPRDHEDEAAVVSSKKESFLVSDAVSSSPPLDINDSLQQVQTTKSKRHLPTVFNKQTFMILYIGDVAVLLTFGWAFPPLALMICLSMIVNSLVKQLWLGRYIVLWKRDAVSMVNNFAGIKKDAQQEYRSSRIQSFSVEESLQRKATSANINNNHNLNEEQSTRKDKKTFSLTTFQKKLFEENILALNEDCGDLMSLLQPMFPPLVFLSTSFIGFFLFDMLGDQVGTLGALWILITMASMPLWVRLGKVLVEAIRRRTIK